jgi:hypothetical protein
VRENATSSFSSIVVCKAFASLVLSTFALAQTNVTTTGLGQGQAVQATGTATVVSDPGVINAVAYTPAGTDISAMINTVYSSATLCPTAGCTIDARGATGPQLTMQNNPFGGRNVHVKLLLGNHTYIACVPWVAPQAGVIVEGAGLMGSVAQGTVIRAGTATECGTVFPNGMSPITTTYQHGPFGAGIFYAVIEDGGSSQRADEFGSQWRDLTVDGNNIANFCIFSASMEEKSGVFHFGCRRPKTACGFWDRAFQDGSGSGPTHFNIFDTSCDIATNTNNQTYGWVYEGSATSITLSGGNCATPPHAYPNVSNTGAVASSTVTYAGALCSNTPGAVSCAVNGSHTTVATCTTSVSSGAVTAVNITAGGSGYLAGNRGAGPWIERSTLRGTSATNQMADAIWLEGTYDPHISDIHCEYLGTNPNDPNYTTVSGGPANCVNHGGPGNAQNSAGQIENIDVGNDSGGGQIVHLAAGGVSGASPSSQGTTLTNISFEGVSGNQTAIQDDTVPPLPVDSLCDGCISLGVSNGNSAIPHYISGWGTERVALRVLPSNFTSSSTMLVAVGNWTWPVLANKSYALLCQISYKGATTSAGLTLAVTGPAAPTNLWVGANVPLSAATFTNGVATAYAPTTVVSSPVATGSGGTFFFASVAGQIMPSQSGSFQLEAASTGTAQLSISQGSWCELKDGN